MSGGRDIFVMRREPQPRGCRSAIVSCLTGDDVPNSLHLVGLISDTHGLIRPEALDALRKSDLIVHCGDIGDPAVLLALRKPCTGACDPRQQRQRRVGFQPSDLRRRRGRHPLDLCSSQPLGARPRSSCCWLHRCRFRPFSQARYQEAGQDSLRQPRQRWSSALHPAGDSCQACLAVGQLRGQHNRARKISTESPMAAFNISAGTRLGFRAAEADGNGGGMIVGRFGDLTSPD